MVNELLYARSPLPGVVEIGIGKKVYRLTDNQLALFNETIAKALTARVFKISETWTVGSSRMERYGLPWGDHTWSLRNNHKAR